MDQLQGKTRRQAMLRLPTWTCRAFEVTCAIQFSKIGAQSARAFQQRRHV
jgi:hypothetical protein